ncbi:hypothetical protein ACFLRA_03070, partial [Bdellovibrionota bacterium]
SATSSVPYADEFNYVKSEVKCVDGHTVADAEKNINELITNLPWGPSVSAPGMTLKHSGLEKPYVICVTASWAN